jgi:hypothetical protein
MGYNGFLPEEMIAQEALIEGLIHEYCKYLQDFHTNEVYVVYAGGDCMNIERDEAIAGDAKLAILSLAIIFFYAWFHVGSLFISTFGMLGILLSYAFVVPIQIGVFGQSVSFMNLISMWIIFGIGVDDIFVFTDTWAQIPEFDTRGRPIPLSLQLSVVMRKAGWATFATSFTTVSDALRRVACVTCHFVLQ